MSVDYENIGNELSEAIEQISAFISNVEKKECTKNAKDANKKEPVENNDNNDDEDENENKASVKNKKPVKNVDEEKDKKIADLTELVTNLADKIANLEKALAEKKTVENDDDETKNKEQVKNNKDKEPTKNTEDENSVKNTDDDKTDNKAVKNEQTFDQLLAKTLGFEHVHEAQAVLNDLIEQKRQNKKELIDTIVANCQGIYKEDELDNKSVSELQKLATFVSQTKQSHIDQSNTSTPNYNETVAIENADNFVLDIPSTFPGDK
ncbi:MAG: hypothetical protein LBP59_11090 [Planctomycetaceae bacterium]|jgi:Ca-activated chloride channel family protein|nr:hypothetical protein [Planctomycetaceae bacterium]